MQVQEITPLQLSCLDAVKDHGGRRPPDLESTRQEPAVEIHLLAPGVVRAFAAKPRVKGTDGLAYLPAKPEISSVERSSRLGQPHRRIGPIELPEKTEQV